MIPQEMQGSILWESLFAAGVVAISTIASMLVVLMFNRVLKVITRKTRTSLDDLLIKALGRPIFLFVLAQGFFIALTSLTFLDEYQTQLNKAWLLVIIAVITLGVQRTLSALMTWYGQEVASKTGSMLDNRLVPILKRIVTVVVYVVALVIILDDLGIAISPLIAGLGIGGLAVALALQPTLSNFFASAYIVSEGRIGIGDFIQLEGGPSGIVEDIGWRTTKIRSLQNNLIIIPNSKFADSVVTNYQAPSPEVFVMVACGVSYESDLEQVRRVTLEVARQVINETPEAVKEFEPVVRFYEFADSNINFRTILQAKDYLSQFTLTDAFISRLHRRFAYEGIEINYPVRKLVYAPQNGVRPEGLDRSDNLNQGSRANWSRSSDQGEDASALSAGETDAVGGAPDF